MINIYDNYLNKKCVLPYNVDFLDTNGYTIKDVYPYFLEDWFYSTDNIIYPKLENGKIVEKTTKELKLEGTIPLEKGECIKGTEIVYKQYPKDLLSYDWDGKNWFCITSVLEKQNIYKRKMLDLNKQTKELNEIGLGGGADEVKLKLELEKYKKLYMDAVHEEANKINNEKSPTVGV